MLLRLTRDPVLAVGAPTTGTLTAGLRFFYTIEQPWANNAKGASCVPPGLYSLVPYTSPVHGDTWCLYNPSLNIFGPGVPIPRGGRSFCELHSANWASQLEGCIALGTDKRPMMDPKTCKVAPAIENSRCAVSELVAILGPLSPGHYLSIS